MNLPITLTINNAFKPIGSLQTIDSLPNLENLTLLGLDLELSTLFGLINGNFSLKKLSLHVRLWDEGIIETIKNDLAQILSCDHGIQEIQFCNPKHPRHGIHGISWHSSEDAIWTNRTIKRDEFPELICYLQNRKQYWETKVDPYLDLMSFINEPEIEPLFKKSRLTTSEK